ncbi:MAG: class I SAM-dependent methyltransferase [Ferruginibacter sp.]
MRFLQYFFYIAFNWNPRIALHMIRHEIRGEKKYGINSTGADELHSLEANGIDIDNATIYMPAPYDLLEEVFEKLSIGSFKHMIDIGCGKGRAMCVAAAFGAKKITGIDFSKELCRAAEANLHGYRKKFPELVCTILNNEAFYYDIPPDADCIFMFNPFDEVIMSGVIENIDISLQQNPRSMTIIYFNPLEKHLFTAAGFKELHHVKRLKYLEYTVLKN